MSEEALQRAVKSERQRRKERYTHLNAEFQRRARRDKKAFLSYQCKEIEEYNKMVKIRDLFKKFKDTKGTFHAKKSTIKDKLYGPNRSRRYSEEVARIYRRCEMSAIVQ